MKCTLKADTFENKIISVQLAAVGMIEHVVSRWSQSCKIASCIESINCLQQRKRCAILEWAIKKYSNLRAKKKNKEREREKSFCGLPTW